MRKQLLLSTGILCLMLAPVVSYGQGPGEKREEPKQMRPAESGKGASQERGAERAQERGQGAEQRAQGAAGREQQGNREERGTGSRQSEEKGRAAPSNERPATASDDRRGRGEDARSSERAQDSRQDDMKRDNARGKSAAEQEKSKDGTTSAQREREGEATQKESGRDQRDSSKRAAEQDKDANRPSTATDTTRTPPSTNAQSAPTGSTNRTQTSQQSNIAVDKQVRISETFTRERLAAPARDINVSIRVGERIPDRVRVHRLPDTIVSIEPEYRGYDYFTTEEEIVIVEPRTQRIVSHIPRDASRSRAAGGTSGTSGVSGTPGYTGTVAAASGASPCRIMRRDTAGNLTELTPQTVGSTAQQESISVTVRVPGGATTAPIALSAPDGQIVVSGQSGADCMVTIEPQPR